MSIDRDEAIQRIRAGLKRRTGRAWSVTGGRGTAWGWITIDAPPARRTWGYRLPPGLADQPGNYQPYDTAQPGRGASPQDRAVLGEALGLERPAGAQGESIPASSDYRQEYIDRAEGRAPSMIGEPYWD